MKLNERYVQLCRHLEVKLGDEYKFDGLLGEPIAIYLNLL